MVLHGVFRNAFGLKIGLGSHSTTGGQRSGRSLWVEGTDEKAQVYWRLPSRLRRLIVPLWRKRKSVERIRQFPIRRKSGGKRSMKSVQAFGHNRFCANVIMWLAYLSVLGVENFGAETDKVEDTNGVVQLHRLVWVNSFGLSCPPPISYHKTTGEAGGDWFRNCLWIYGTEDEELIHVINPTGFWNASSLIKSEPWVTNFQNKITLEQKLKRKKTSENKPYRRNSPTNTQWPTTRWKCWTTTSFLHSLFLTSGPQKPGCRYSTRENIHDVVSNNKTWVQTKVWANVPTARGVIPLWVADTHAVRGPVARRVGLAAAPHMWNRTSRLARRASMSGFAKASSILLPEGKGQTQGTEEQPANHDRGRWAGVRGLESASWCVPPGGGGWLFWGKHGTWGEMRSVLTIPYHTGQMNLFQCAVRGKGDRHLQAHIAPITSHKPMRLIGV